MAHRKLADHIQHHLEAVVQGNLEATRQHFQKFLFLLQSHSTAEEEILFPAYSNAGLDEPGCSVELLLKEHVKIRRLVMEAKERIFFTGAVLDAASRVAWVEALHMLKEVLAHHDVRERTVFFPKLDAHLGADAHALAAKAHERERALLADLETQGGGI